MVEIKALPNLSEDIILLAHQLSAFSKTGHRFAQVITSQSGEILQFVSEHYADPSAARYPSPEEPTTRRGRSAGLDSADSQASWFLDDGRSKVRKAQADLLTATVHILEHPCYLGWKRTRSPLSTRASSPSSFVTGSMGDESLPSDLDARIAAAVQQALANLDVRPRQQSPDPPASTTNLPAFKIEEIGYFHPDLDKSYGEGDVVFSGKDTLIRDVHLFCDRIRDVAELRGDSLVKINLPSCLRGIALQWYMHELSKAMKIAMRHDNGIQM